jgi:tetratricopeptide (TPR) repeat protein
VGFAGQGFPPRGPGDTAGAATPFDPRVLSIDLRGESEERNAVELAGLLARIFGAWTSPDPASILHTPPGSRIDAVTRDIVRLTRDYDFLKGPDSLPAEKRDELLRRWTAAKAEPRSHPLFLYYAGFGNELLARGRPDQAVEPLSRAASLLPSDAAAHYFLAMALLHSRQLRDAASQFRQAAELDPKSAAAWNGLGGALGFLQQWKESAEAFRKALALRPEDPGLRLSVGAALLRTPGGADEGIAQLREGLRLDPKNELGRKTLAAALEMKRRKP